MKNQMIFAAIAAAVMTATSAFAGETALLDGWEFSRGSETNTWEKVRVPHDWAIRGPFDKQHDMQVVAIRENGENKPTEKTGRSGSLPWIGDGWYRREVEIPEGVSFASLVFEGAMSEPEIFWDGAKVGEWKYGYNVFEVELPAEAGRHALMVHCSNLGESSRWYPGAGLYRPVKLITGGKVGIKTFGVFVRTPTLTTWEADVELRNPDKIPVAVTNYVLEGEGPYKAWSPEEPNLYTLVTEVRDGNGALLDRRETRFGFRTLEYGASGFKLNGVKRKFQGVCLHHDLGPIGAEWNAAAFRRQVRKLKWLGCDAIRTSHNMPCPEQMDICDEEGMMVMAESFDMWSYPKCKNGYSRFYDDWWRRDLEMLVKVNRSHPCVVMWSIGNEIPEQSSGKGARMSKEMQDFVHSFDATRPVTQGLNHWPGAGRSGTASTMDILGMNYRLNHYEYAHSLAKDGIVLGSETASSFSSRGCYYFPVKEIKKRGIYHGDGQCSSYDVECADWSNLPDDDRALQEDHDWTIGEFVWTGFDYLGEPSPYDTYWPSRSSYFGMYDLAGLPKDRAWLYRSYWNTKERTLHIVPHWTWPGREGEVTPVYVYTDAPEAEVFVNGKSQGVRRKDKTSRLDRYRLRWNDVVYEPGEVKAVAYYPDGTTAEGVVRTAGEPAQIDIKAEPSYYKPTDLTPALRFFEVSIVDKDGNLCPDAAIPLTFEVTGAACFKGVCNGDATSLEVFTEPKMTTFHGQLVVVVEPTATGAATLTIKGGGLESKIMFATLLAAIGTTATSAIADRTQPVKIALTFDDGFAHHLTLVAPLLEKYGYTGAFSIVTDSIGVREGRLTWDEVRELKARGHDIFSHSCTHPNLSKLMREGNIAEVRHQIFDSCAKIKEETGSAAKVFCFPFNAERHVTGIVREAGMVPMQAKRVNFGDGTWKGGKADIDAHIDRLIAEGRKADALMIHGVGRETGAHRPFKDAAHFERFLQSLKTREEAGDIKVVPYMEIAEDVAPDNKNQK